MKNFTDKWPIDAYDIAAASTQTVSANDFTLEHNSKSVLLLTQTTINGTSSETTAIADGVRIGQKLLIIGVSIAVEVKIKDGANTKLQGDWYRYDDESWLKVVWDGSDWIEDDRDEGVGHTASGASAHAEGGSNVASGDYSHAEGSITDATASRAHAEGYDTTASGTDSHAEGRLTVASGDRSHAEGSSTEASGNNSHAMGDDALADQFGQYAHAVSAFANQGDAQFSRFVLKETVTHSNADWKTIGISDLAIGPVIPADSAWAFEAQVIGSTVDMGKVFSYLVNGCIDRIGASTVLRASNVTTIYETDGDFDCQAVADDTNEALSIQVQDTTSGGDVVHWVATIKLTQITFT